MQSNQVQIQDQSTRDQSTQTTDEDLQIEIDPEYEVQPRRKSSWVSYRTLKHYIINLTIGEYFLANSISDRESKMLTLFTKLDERDSIIKQSIGTSRWEKSDNIKIIIMKRNNLNLCKYIQDNYSAVWMPSVRTH